MHDRFEPLRINIHIRLHNTQSFHEKTQKLNHYETHVMKRNLKCHQRCLNTDSTKLLTKNFKFHCLQLDVSQRIHAHCYSAKKRDHTWRHLTTHQPFDKQQLIQKRRQFKTAITLSEVILEHNFTLMSWDESWSKKKNEDTPQTTNKVLKSNS